VTVIARATGWSESHIRWHLPLTRGWAYYHAQRLHEGERTTWPAALAAEEDWFDNLQQKHQKKTRSVPSV
jgi:hypothetical protein